MKNLFLFIASVLVCAGTFAQEQPPQPLSRENARCMTDTVRYCDYENELDCGIGSAYELYFYSESGLLYKKLWNGGETYTSGVSELLYTYQYDTDSNIIVRLITGTSGSWIEQDLYSDFTAYGYPTYSMQITFGDNNVADTARYRYLYTYNENGQKTEVIELSPPYASSPVSDTVPISDTTYWQSAQHFTYSYTSIGNIDTMTQLWQGSNGNWYGVYRYVFIYSENTGNRYDVSELYQNAYNVMDTTTGIVSTTWTTQYGMINSFVTRCATSGISSLQKNAVKIYPNPFTDKLTIEPDISYRLFDLVGREMDKNNLSVLPVGTYILSTAKGSVRVVKGEE